LSDQPNIMHVSVTNHTNLIGVPNHYVLYVSPHYKIHTLAFRMITMNIRASKDNNDLYKDNDGQWYYKDLRDLSDWSRIYSDPGYIF
jgi:hypothetical protein